MKKEVLDHELAAAVHLLLVDSDKSSYHAPFLHMFHISYVVFGDLLYDTALTLVDLAAVVGLVDEYAY